MAFSFFSKDTNNSGFSEECLGGTHFAYALASFTLAHNELIAYSTSLKIKEVVGKATDLAAAAQEMAAMSEETSASTEEISASMQVLRNGEQENFERVNNLAKLTKEADVVLNNMVDNVHQLVDQIEDIDHISQNVSEIADQTNLLSLNAAIEAAHAGEQGKGFTVVAEEVRKLADKTKVAVKEVITISNEMNTKAGNSVEVVSRVQETFEQYLTDTTKVTEVVHRNMELVEESTGAVDDIAHASQEQALTTENIARVSDDLASNADFGNTIIADANDLSNIISPYINIEENNHVLSILAARLIEHADFLRNTIATAGQGAKTVGHKECAFGQWYVKVHDRYKHLEEFKAIDEPHRQFHDLAEIISNNPSLDIVQQIISASLSILESFIKLSKAVQIQD